MDNITIVIVLLSFGILSATANPAQEVSHMNVVPDCGKVSFVQKGQNTQMFFDEDVNKKCYNIQSSQNTTLHLQTAGCNYNVEAFSMADCDEDSDVKLFPLNSDNHEVNFNTDHQEISSYMILSKL